MGASIKLEAVPGTSISSLAKGYVLTHQTEGSSPHTVEYFKGTLNRFLWYASREGWPDDARILTQWHIREFLGYVASEVGRWGKKGNGAESSASKASPRTIHHYYSVLRSFFNWTVKEGFLTQSPVSMVKVAKPKERVIRPYSIEQIRKMLDVCDYDYQHNAKFLGSRNKAIVLVLLDSGLRVSELANIKLQDMDTDRGWIKVMGKGAKERIVPIGKFVQRTLWVYIQKGRPEPASSDCDYLFLSPSGKRITVNTIKLLFSRLAKKSGVERLHAHLCRHTFAVNYLLNGGDIFSLQQILGHTTLEMVRHYLHFTSSQIIVQHHKYSPMDKLQAEAESKEPLALALNK